MKMKYILTLILLVLNPALFAQVDLKKTAQSTMNFLLVGISPKASAMGEAFTSIGTGTESIFYNPAGLAIMDNQFEVSANYTMWIADINYLGGSFAFNAGNFGTFGLHLITVDYGVINGTSLLANDIHPLGYIDNGPVSNVGAYSVGLTYAKAISNEFSIGGTVKLAGQNLGRNVYSDGVEKDNDAVKLAFDAGVRYNTGYKGFVFGMYIRNFSSNIKRELIDEQLPLIFSLGASIDAMQAFNLASDNSLILSVDFLHQNNYSERVNIGMEYKLFDMISLRGGYQTNRDLASWSGGIGVNTSLIGYDVEVAYSYSSFEIFNSVNRLSLSFAF